LEAKIRQTWYFVFGKGVKEEHRGKYVKFFGSYMEARGKMQKHFGEQWRYQYAEEAWISGGFTQAEIHGLTELKIEEE